jgi:hypothetical protein
MVIASHPASINRLIMAAPTAATVNFARSSLGEVEYPVAQLRECATVMGWGSHRPNFHHRLFIAQLAADGAQVQRTDVATFHRMRAQFAAWNLTI